VQMMEHTACVLKIFIFMMNVKLVRNIFGYREFCIKVNQEPKIRRSLFMVETKGSIDSDSKRTVSYAGKF
jgi:hypothetical protein